MAKFATVLAIIVAVATLVQQGNANAEAPLPNGFYKIQNVVDNSALTATWNGRPRAVITDDYNSLSTQEWKLRSEVYDDEPLEIIRNENIKDNEIAKEEGPPKPPKKLNFIPIEWNFIPVPSQQNTFALNNGIGCVNNNGKGQRISFEECDETNPSQQWHFTYLFAHL